MKNFFSKYTIATLIFFMAAPLFMVNVAHAASTPWLNSKEIPYDASVSGTWDIYNFDVPSGTSELRFDMFTASSPALYVRYGAEPTLADYDAMADTPVSNYLSITPITNPTAGTWYFGIYSSSGTDTGWGYPRYPLEDGVATTAVDVYTDDYFEFYIKDISSGGVLTGTTTGDAGGDVDLDVYDFDYNDDCYVDTPSDANETCTVDPTTVTGNYYFYVGVYSDTTNFTIQADYTPPASATTIVNGEITTTGEITDTNFEYFKISVPSGGSNLQIATSGNGTGACTTCADLYQKFGSAPTTSVYDNVSATGGTNSESITVASPTSGDNYMGVYANGGTINGVTLTANFTNGALSKNVNETGLSVSEGEWQHFSFAVPSGATDLALTTSGGSGNVDLYTKFNGYPTTSSNDGSDTGAGTSKSISIPSPSTGSYTVSIRGGTGGASNVTLNANYTPNVPSTSMFNGQKITGISATAGNYEYYDVTIASGNLELDGKTDNDGAETGNVDLYHRFDDAPTTSVYDNAGILWGTNNQEYITVDTPTAGTHYFGLYANSTFSGVNFQTRWLNSEISKGVDETGIATTNAGEWAFYQITIPNTLSDVSDLVIQTSGGTGNLELYVEEEDWPTTSATYSSTSDPGNDESITIASPTKGMIYYIGLYSSSTFSGVTLNADYTLTEGTWVSDEVPSVSVGDVQSTTDGQDFLWASGNIYKRNGRNWVSQTAAAGSFAQLSDSRLYVQNGANVNVYSRSGSTWSDAGFSLNGKTMKAAAGNYVVTSDLRVYDCSTDCSTYDTLAGISSFTSMATDGTKIVVGYTGYGAKGAIWVFGMDGTLEQGPIEPTQGINGFGYSVGIHDDQVIVGMQFGFDDDNPCVGGTCPGSAYIYKYTGGSWQTQQIVGGSDSGDGQSSSGHTFGAAVDIYQNYAIVSATTKNGPLESDWGSSVYIFEKTAGSPDDWNEIINFEFANNPGDGFNSDNWYFGSSVSLTGNYYYGFAAPTPLSGSGVIINNNPSGAGSGGGSVPEFSDYVLMITLLISLYFIFKLVPKIGGRQIGNA